MAFSGFLGSKKEISTFVALSVKVVGGCVGGFKELFLGKFVFIVLFIGGLLNEFIWGAYEFIGGLLNEFIWGAVNEFIGGLLNEFIVLNKLELGGGNKGLILV